MTASATPPSRREPRGPSFLARWLPRLHYFVAVLFVLMGLLALIMLPAQIHLWAGSWVVALILAGVGWLLGRILRLEPPGAGTEES